MPHYRAPWLSGVHRHACLALYRALLWQCDRVPLQADRRLDIRRFIQSKFRQSRWLQSHRAIAKLLKAGYESEELLNAAGNGDQVAASKVVSLLAKLFPEPKTRPPHKPITPKTPPITPKPWLRPSPYPNAPSILSRPRLSLPGPRHVPILASVCGFPMLRTKTPQSPFLSRMIRFLVARRQRYFDVLSTLEEMQKHAELEDAWDGEMRLHGIVEEGGAWAHDIAVATSYLEGINKAQFRRTLALTRAMQVVVKGERELWEKERAEGKQKKREERLKRRS